MKLQLEGVLLPFPALQVCVKLQRMLITVSLLTSAWPYFACSGAVCRVASIEGGALFPKITT